MPSFPNPPRTWTAGDEMTAALLNAQLRDAFSSAFPVGSFHYFMQAGSSVETTINGAWLECNGVAVSRTTYANLHSLISGLSYPFGNGDGTTTFNLPDARGRILIHAAAGGNADVNGLGDNDGVTLASRTPHHTTGATGATHSHTVTDPGHTHGPGSGTTFQNHDSGSQTVAGGGAASFPTSAATASATTGISIPTSGSHTHGPGGSTPTDLVPWVVAGIWAVRY